MEAVGYLLEEFQRRTLAFKEDVAMPTSLLEV